MARVKLLSPLDIFECLVVRIESKLISYQVVMSILKTSNNVIELLAI